MWNITYIHNVMCMYAALFVLSCIWCCLCELAVRLVTMATRWSLATHADRVSAMVTVSTPTAESCVIGKRECACHVLATLKADTANAVDVDTTAPQ